MTKQLLEPVASQFSYNKLDKRVADKARMSAERIKQKVRKTLEDLIEIGQHLLAVKDALPHGQFGAWLKLEFGWAERTARNFMSVASQFGPKTAFLADLTIQPTAAYLLAAPSVSEEARQKAVERAEAGEEITTAVAKEIMATARKEASKRTMPTESPRARLLRRLERLREQWDPKNVSEFAQCLRDFAESLEETMTGNKKR